MKCTPILEQIVIECIRKGRTYAQAQKNPNIEGVEKNAYCSGPDHRKGRRQVSTVRQGYDCLGTEIESRKGMMEQGANNREIYLVCQKDRFFVERPGPETHLWR